MRSHSRSLVNLIHDKLGGVVKLGAEIGVWRGQTSQALLQMFPYLTLVCVDPWDSGGGHTTMPKTKEELQAGRNEFYELTDFARSRRIVVEKTSVEAFHLFALRKFDFGFVDAEHTYPEVRRDVDLWSPVIRPGGLFCGHDYDGKGDRTGQFGVKIAVDEWAAKKGLKIEVAPRNIWWTIIP